MASIVTAGCPDPGVLRDGVHSWAGKLLQAQADLVLLFLQLVRECSEPLHLLLLETFYYKKMFLEPEETSQSKS